MASPSQSQQIENSQPDQDGLDNGYSSVYLSCYDNEDELQPDADELESLERLPSFSQKRPRQATPEVANDPWTDEPDLGDFFSNFPHFTESDQVKYCRAYASMLAAKSTRNRLRMGHGKNPFH